MPPPRPPRAGAGRARGYGLAGLVCAGGALWRARSLAGSFVQGGWLQRGRPSVDRATWLARHAVDPDLDDVVFIDDEDGGTRPDEWVPEPMPEVKETRKFRAFLDEGIPLTEDPGAGGKELPKLGSASETLDAAAKKVLEKGTGGGAAKKKRGGKKKRWLMGRGNAKRRKLQENNDLKKWLEDNDVWVSEANDWGVASSGVAMAVETRESAENEVSGRGIVARREIDQYEDLIRVPWKLAITRDSAQEKWGKKLITNTMSEYSAIALYIIDEKFNTENSFWEPYLKVLPSIDDVGCSIFWTQEELDTLLDGSPLRNQSIYLRSRVREEFYQLQDVLFSKEPEKFPPDAFTIQNFEWAYSLLFSRAMRLDFEEPVDIIGFGDEKPKTADVVAMVPYVDLINHNPSSETIIRGAFEGYSIPGVRSAEKYISVKADKYYQQFEQIYISYGQKSNGQLLMLYGFAVERNSMDFMDLITKHLLESSPMSQAKRRFLESKNFKYESFPLYRDRMTQQMMAFMRLLVLEQSDLKLVGDNLVGDKLEDAIVAALETVPLDRAFGEVSERRAMLCLRGLCEELASGYPTTLEQDEEILEDRSLFDLLPKKQRMAMRVRYGEKMILRNTMDVIDKIMNNLGRITELEEEDAKYWDDNKDNIWGRLGLKPSDAMFKARNIEELMQELDV